MKKHSLKTLSLILLLPLLGAQAAGVWTNAPPPPGPYSPGTGIVSTVFITTGDVVRWNAAYTNSLNAGGTTDATARAWSVAASNLADSAQTSAGAAQTTGAAAYALAGQVSGQLGGYATTATVAALQAVALTNASAFATASQGALATSALQPGSTGLFMFVWTTNNTKRIALTGQSVTEPEAWPTGTGTVWIAYHSGLTHESDYGQARLALLDYRGNVLSDSLVASNANYDVNNPQIIRTASGTLLYFHTLYNLGAYTEPQVYCLRSTNNGATWSAASAIYTGVTNANAHGRGVVVGNTILKPFNVFTSSATNLSSALMLKSEDDGLTWTPSYIWSHTNANASLYEPCMAWVGGSNLVCTLRAYTNGAQQCWTTRSADLGATWTTPKRIFTTTGKNSLTRLSNGYLIITFRGYGCEYRASADNGDTITAGVGTMDTDMSSEAYSTGFEVASNVMACIYSAEMSTSNAQMRMKLGGMSGNSWLGDLWGTAHRAVCNVNGDPFGSWCLSNTVNAAQIGGITNLAVSGPASIAITNGNATLIVSNQAAGAGSLTNIIINGTTGTVANSMASVTVTATSHSTFYYAFASMYNTTALTAVALTSYSTVPNNWSWTINTNSEFMAACPSAGVGTTCSVVYCVAPSGSGSGQTSDIETYFFSEISNAKFGYSTNSITFSGNYAQMLVTNAPLAVTSVSNTPNWFIVHRLPNPASGTPMVGALYLRRATFVGQQ